MIIIKEEIQYLNRYLQQIIGTRLVDHLSPLWKKCFGLWSRNGSLKVTGSALNSIDHWFILSVGSVQLLE